MPASRIISTIYNCSRSLLRDSIESSFPRFSILLLQKGQKFEAVNPPRAKKKKRKNCAKGAPSLSALGVRGG